MKVCGVCKQEKDESQFHRKGSGLQYQCMACQKVYRDRHYAENRDKYIANARAFGDRSKVFIDSLKNRPCLDCGQSFPPYVMDFDHRPGEQKLFDVSYGARGWRGREATLAEIAKCDLVCANCHRIRTHDRESAQVRFLSEAQSTTGPVPQGRPPTGM